MPRYYFQSRVVSSSGDALTNWGFCTVINTLNSRFGNDVKKNIFNIYYVDCLDQASNAINNIETGASYENSRLEYRFVTVNYEENTVVSVWKTVWTYYYLVVREGEIPFIYDSLKPFEKAFQEFKKLYCTDENMIKPDEFRSIGVRRIMTGPLSTLYD